MGKPNITIAKEDVRPSNYYTNDELYQRPMTAAENRIIRTLSKGILLIFFKFFKFLGPVDMNNTYETMSKVMGSKDRLPKFFAGLILKNLGDR